MLIKWLILGMILMITEFLTVSFLYIFLAVGCVIAGLVSLITPSIGIQVLVACFVTLLGVLFGRKTLQKWFNINKEVKHSTVNAIIGKTGIVMKEISENKIGLVKIDGEQWSSVELTGEAIPKDSKVKVVNIEGVKLVVKKI